MARGALFIIDVADVSIEDRRAVSTASANAGIRPLPDINVGNYWVVYKNLIRYCHNFHAIRDTHPGVPILSVHETMEVFA